MPYIWAMKMEPTASYSAVPSMLMVAPTGSTNRVTLLSILLFSSKHRKVMGSVAELWGKGLCIVSNSSSLFSPVIYRNGHNLTKVICLTMNKHSCTVDLN